MKSLWTSLLLTVILFSCSKSSDNPAENKPNQPPGTFQASVSNTTINSAQLNWTVATDPEGKNVSYSVTLGPDTLVRKQSITSYALTNLQLKTNYSGSVIAYDVEGNTTKAGYSFSTFDHPTPSDFTISQQIQGITSSTIEWSASTLTDNSAVTYDVYLNAQLVATNLSVRNYQFTSLQEKTNYTAKVVAKSSQGKSLEKTFAFSTRENTAPSAPVLSVTPGFSGIEFSFTPSVDPSGTTLSYSLYLNGNYYSTLGSVGPNKTNLADGLISGTNYQAEIRVQNTLGDVTFSNKVAFATFSGPSLSSLTLSNTDNSFTLSFNKGTNASFKSISLMVNGDVTSFTPTSSQINGNVITVTYSNSILSPAVYNKLRLSIDWGMNQGGSTTSEVTYRYYNYTATTVSVYNAYITTTPYIQFNISFVNSIISEFNDYNWEVIDVAFEQFHFSNLLMLGLGAPNKTYITGNLSATQVDALRSGSKGYVIVKDASGYHKHNFTYTIQ